MVNIKQLYLEYDFKCTQSTRVIESYFYAMICSYKNIWIKVKI